MTYRDQIEMDRIPAHVAIIMDGNGRWANSKGLPRTAGHVEGVNVVRLITEEATRLGVKFLTLYTFSTENWNRPIAEVEALMNLVLTNLEEEIFMKNNVRFRMIGDMERLPESVQKRLQETIDRTSVNTGMTMVIALSYSSKWELTRAMQSIATDVSQGLLQSHEITEEIINQRLQTNFMPDPDLLIRTGGEKRISNYLLWQCAYSEFYFTDQYWPDFREESLCQAIVDYQQRQRRYGKTGQQIDEEQKKN